MKYGKVGQWQFQMLQLGTREKIGGHRLQLYVQSFNYAKEHIRPFSVKITLAKPECLVSHIQFVQAVFRLVQYACIATVRRQGDVFNVSRSVRLSVCVRERES